MSAFAFSVEVGLHKVSIDSSAQATVTYAGLPITQPELREIHLLEIISKLATELANSPQATVTFTPDKDAL